MDQIHVTYVDNEHADNHEYDDNTDDDHDNKRIPMVITMMMYAISKNNSYYSYRYIK